MSDFEMGVRTIMDQRMAGLDFALSGGDRNIDTIEERIAKWKELRQKVADLALETSPEDFRCMTDEACERLMGITDAIEAIGEIDG